MFALWIGAEPPLIVDAPSAFEAQKWAATHAYNNVSPSSIRTAVIAHGNPTVELEWRGHDAGPTNKFLWVRTRPNGSFGLERDFSEWERV